MNASDFIAGPLHIDGFELNFFVNLMSPYAALEVLAAAYTVLIMREKKDELIFEAYAKRRTRMSEDEWYATAQDYYQSNLSAISQASDILQDVQMLVERMYFKKGMPADLKRLTSGAGALMRAEVAHAA
jgi:hypothetical protein